MKHVVKSILLVEDHPLLAAGLYELVCRINPAWEVYCASRFEEAESLLKQHTPDMLIADVQLLDDSRAGIRLLALARIMQPAIRTVIYTQFDDLDTIEAGILAGADGYVVKYEPEDQVRKVIEHVADGEYYLSPVVAKLMIQIMKKRETADDQPDRLKALTTEDLALIRLIGLEVPKKLIANQLGVAQATVYAQCKRIAEKINVVGDVGIVLFARKHGLI